MFTEINNKKQLTYVFAFDIMCMYFGGLDGDTMSEAIKYTNSVIALPMTTAYAHVILFLNQKKKRSENTYAIYDGYVKEFCMFLFAKPCEQVSWEDYCSVTKSSVLQYQDFLSSKGNNNNTINQKTSALKKLWKFLMDEKKGLSDTAFNVELLPVDKNNPNGYGSFSAEEMTNLIEFAKTHKTKGNIKSLYIETAYVTAIRKECLLNMKWIDLIHDRDKASGKMVYFFRFHDKGKDEVTPISDALANKLFTLKTKNTSPMDRIFSLNKETIAETLSSFCDAYDIPSERNLTIHSIKKASGDMIHAMLNDITVTAKHLHHSNIQTPYNNYLGKNQNLVAQPSYYAFEKEYDMDGLKNLSHEELLSVIEKTGRNIVMQLIMTKESMGL